MIAREFVWLVTIISVALRRRKELFRLMWEGNL